MHPVLWFQSACVAAAAAIVTQGLQAGPGLGAQAAGGVHVTDAVAGGVEVGAGRGREERLEDILRSPMFAALLPRKHPGFEVPPNVNAVVESMPGAVRLADAVALPPPPPWLVPGSGVGRCGGVPMPYVLSGTLVGEGADRVAVLRHELTGEVMVRAIGEFLDGGMYVSSVREDRVEVRGDAGWGCARLGEPADVSLSADGAAP